MNTGSSGTERVRAAAAAAGLQIEVRRMAETTRTAEDAAKACGVDVAQIVKSLVFRLAPSGDPVLLLVSGKNRVDPAAIAAQIGQSVEPLDARAVREITGFAIGGVAPLGSSTPLRTFMDRDLLEHDTVWAAAGAPFAVFAVAPADLAAAAGARIIPVC